MKVGTKSILFGAHCFLIHPFFVALAWIKLYGFPWDPRIWIAFFVHDLGYWGKPNMDGPEGETHVELGAKIMHFLFDYPNYEYRKICDRNELPVIWWPYFGSRVFIKRVLNNRWYNFSLYHSRFYAKKDGAMPSRLCIADKLAIAITPSWLYLPLVNLSGEVKEYMSLAVSREASGEKLSKYESMRLNSNDQKQWYQGMQSYMVRWVAAHKYGEVDTWTPEVKTKSVGVYQ